MPDNLLTSAEIKRRGMAVIEERLRLGPVHIMKRNKRAAVVLTEEAYRRLIGAKSADVPGTGAVQWLLGLTSTGGRSREEIDAALRAERDW
jgi:hypothetical protein